MSLLLQYTLIFASVLILVALGGCFSEHSGVINLGLEGVMIMGALGGALAMRYMPTDSSAFSMLIVVLLAAALAGTVYSSLLAVACINFKADQTIVGTALNMLGTAGATVIVKAINTAANPDDVSSIVQYGGAKSALLVSIGSFEFNWFMLVAFIALVFAYVTLYKTRFGLRLMACGEHPQAAASVGINVYKMRWAGVLISGLLGGLGGIVMVARTKTGLGWIIALAVAAMLLLVGVLMKIAMPQFRTMQQRVDDVNLVSREVLTGLPVIRAFHRERHEEKRFGAASAALRDTQLFVNRTMAFMGPVMTLIMYGVTVMIEWFGAKSINAGNMQIGDMIAFSTYASLIIMAFMMITIVAVLLPRAEVSATRVDEILRTRASVRDPRSPEPVPTDATVTFDHVSFRYPGAEDDVLHDISFTARPGEVTAIVGSTGCGKSTLLNLIPRFYDATGGTVSIGGVNVRRLPQAGLRAMLGYVPQKGVLFTGDILSNLEFAGDVSEADAIRAAATAQAEDFIWSRPHHFLTPVAQGGANVSGGQRQRLSIARAIAKHPQVYLFDDSFSALDYQTDAALRQALAKQTHDATVIIVAQRLSTILHADQILVLDGGRIIGCGTHSDLLRGCETYREIALSQLSAAELGEEG